MKRINDIRELLDSIRKAGADGRRREIANAPEGFRWMVSVCRKTWNGPMHTLKKRRAATGPRIRAPSGASSHAARTAYPCSQAALPQRQPGCADAQRFKALFDEGEGRDRWLRPDREVRLRAALDAHEPRMRDSHA